MFSWRENSKSAVVFHVTGTAFQIFRSSKEPRRTMQPNSTWGFVELRFLRDRRLG